MTSYFGNFIVVFEFYPVGIPNTMATEIKIDDHNHKLWSAIVTKNLP